MSSANRANPYSLMRGGALGSTVTGILLAAICIFALYFLYKWLMTGDSAHETTTILSGTAPMGANATTSSLGTSSSSSITESSTCGDDTSIVASSQLTRVMDGGQYSVSFWVYVSDTKGFLTAGSAPLAHLFEISDGSSSFSGKSPRSGNTLLFVGLNPKNGGLVVRQSSSDASEQINNRLNGYQGGSYPLKSLITNYNQESMFQAKDKCDIPNGIEYQRWVLVGVVGNGRTLDIYIDGKLARSCVYKGNWALGNGQGKAKIAVGFGNGSSLRGFFSNANYYNWAMSPEEMWRTYQRGPGGPFSLWNWLTQYFSVSVNLNTKGESQTSPCNACANSA